MTLPALPDETAHHWVALVYALSRKAKMLAARYDVNGELLEFALEASHRLHQLLADYKTRTRR